MKIECLHTARWLWGKYQSPASISDDLSDYRCEDRVCFVNLFTPDVWILRRFFSRYPMDTSSVVFKQISCIPVVECLQRQTNVIYKRRQKAF